MYDREQLAFSAALAEAHYRWTGRQLGAAGFDHERAQREADYNLHSVDVEGGPGSEEGLRRELQRLGWALDADGRPRRVTPS